MELRRNVAFLFIHTVDRLVAMVQEEENASAGAAMGDSPLVKPPTGFPGSITDAGQSAGIIIGS